MKTCNILTLVAAAAAAMLLASCQSLEQNIETPEETGVTRDADGHLLIPFSAETGAAQTKAEMLGGSTANIVYSEGDKMIVFSTSMSTSCPVLPSIMNLVGGVGTKKGTFKGDIVLRSGKTEADFNTWVTKYPGNLKAVIIPAAGIEAGLFTWDASKHDLRINFTKGSISSDLEELVKKTVLFLGEVNYAEKKITNLTMGTSYVKSAVTVPSESDWTGVGKDFTVTLRYDGVWGGYAFLTPTAMLKGDAGGTTLTFSGWNNAENYEATGTFALSGSTKGTLYMALLAAYELRANSDEYEADDKQSFTLTMENVGKGYSLYEGKIAAFAIERGKGFSKAVTMLEPTAEDVLLNQPASVRTAIMTTKGADLNKDGRLTMYEAAQFNSSDTDAFGLKDNTDLTDASFFRYFTGMIATNYDLFNGCINLTKVCFPKSLKSIDTDAFTNCKKLSTILWGESSVSSVDFSFNYCTSLTSITLPETVKSLGGSFIGCTALEFVDLSATSVTTLNGAPFQDCTALETINLPLTLTTIGPSCFEGCTKLASIKLPASLTKIDDRAFALCAALKSITFPATVTRIGKNVLLGTTGLTPVHFLSMSSPTGFYYVCENVCTNASRKIYVPTAAVSTYKSTLETVVGGSKYYDYIVGE